MPGRILPGVGACGGDVLDVPHLGRDCYLRARISPDAHGGVIPMSIGSAV